jgi:predicted O-linked N-acetylglucosamine transferase (SPINDLY family)
MGMQNEEMAKAVDQFNQGHKEAALIAVRKIESSNPNNLDIKYNYALMLGLSGNYVEEQKKYKEIITINPKDCGAYVNLAVSLNETNNYQEAIQYSSEALDINPNIAEAYEARGIARQHQDLIEEANLDFRKWLNLIIKNEITQYSATLRECLELIKLKAIYESEEEINLVRKELEQKARHVLENVKKIPIAFLQTNNLGAKIAFKLNRFYLAYHQKKDKELNKIYNEITASLLNREIQPKATKNKKEKKLCVVSTFKYHPNLFIIDQLRDLDKTLKVVLIIINNSKIKLDGIPKNFEIIHLNLSPENLNEVIQKIINEDIDILFMPDIGMSIESQILATFKLAEVSIMGWLHPITSGSKNINYFLSGELMETPESSNEYTEKLIKLPGIGLKINPEKYISTTLKKIQNKQINEDLKVGCLQTPFKYHPQYDYVLIEIAKKIPKASFIFIRYQDDLDKNLMQRLTSLFEKNGLDSRVIKIQDRLQKENYKTFLNTLDIALDSLGWSGGNTTLDCLGAGVPIFTLKNNLMRSNHTAGIYELIGIKDLISTTPEELINKIYNFSLDREYLKKLQCQIFENFINLKSDFYTSHFINELSQNIKK